MTDKEIEEKLQSMKAGDFAARFPNGITCGASITLYMAPTHEGNSIEVQLNIPEELHDIGPLQQRILNSHVFKAAQILASGFAALASSDEVCALSMQHSEVADIVRQADTAYIGGDDVSNPSRIN